MIWVGIALIILFLLQMLMLACIGHLNLKIEQTQQGVLIFCRKVEARWRSQ